jgi:ABC-type multidrug transport system fused ATPase/permease subunit
MLDRADDVVLLENGHVVAVGTHRELMSDPRYRRIVARGEDE